MANVEYLIEYDKTDPISIEVYSQKLIGKTFREICEEDEARQSTIIREEDERYGENDAVENKRNKGNLGQIIEERFFHYACNSDARADFYEAGVELKVTPYRINQNGSLSAKERLILTMIDYFQVVNETFEESHFLE
jgi:DNA mismatch repair enzyme MutH.